jgi:hypothetical protein
MKQVIPCMPCLCLQNPKGEALEENKESLKHTAFHEAGHAVIGYRFNILGDELSIMPDYDKGTDGHHTQEPWDGTEGNAIEQIIVLYAGAEADRQAFPNMKPKGVDDDDEKASNLLSYVPNEAKENLRGKASSLVKENWKAISAIAEELLQSKKLSWEEWSIIIDAIDEGEDWRKVLSQVRENMKDLHN